MSGQAWPDSCVLWPCRGCGARYVVGHEAARRGFYCRRCYNAFWRQLVEDVEGEISCE